MQHRGYSFNTSVDFEYLKEIKEHFCYVALDPEQEERLADQTTVLNEVYQMPDGRKVTVSKERFLAPELLFKPELQGIECQSIAQALYDAVEASPMDCRKGLMKGIVMSGCTTLFPGLHTRLKKELMNIFEAEKIDRLDASGQPTVTVSPEDKQKQLARYEKMIKIDDPPNRKYSVF